MIEVATHSVADRHAELPPPLTEESIPSFDFSEVYRPALAGANKNTKWQPGVLVQPLYSECLL